MTITPIEELEILKHQHSQRSDFDYKVLIDLYTQKVK